MLEPQQVRAIRHLVASAVNGLKPERVSIVDEAGRLLADGARSDNAMGVTADERQIAYERRLREQVETIVTSVVGPGRARVQLTADFDFNRVTQTSDQFDPEGRVVRSSQTREESSGSDDQRRPGHGRQRAARRPARRRKTSSSSRASRSRKTEEIVNYEISRTTKTEVTEGGRVNRISVAVLVDGIYTKNDKGEAAYQPRDKEEIDRIAALVRTAIGFDQQRGDQVEVVNLRFAETPATPIDRADRLAVVPAIHQGRHHALGRAAGDGAARPGRAAVVVRPLVRRILAPEHGRDAAAAIAAAIAGGDMQTRDRRRRHRRRRSRRRSEPDRQDDRHRPGAGPGPRPVGAEGRRARRQEPERNRLHHPHLAARERSLIDTAMTHHGPRHTNRAQARHRERGRHARQPPARAASRRASSPGPERAAVLMLALGEQHGGKIWNLLDDDELRELSIVMSTLGTIEARVGREPAARIRRPACRRPAR